jgi:hypothetical protein
MVISVSDHPMPNIRVCFLLNLSQILSNTFRSVPCELPWVISCPHSPPNSIRSTHRLLIHAKDIVLGQDLQQWTLWRGDHVDGVQNARSAHRTRREVNSGCPWLTKACPRAPGWTRASSGHRPPPPDSASARHGDRRRCLFPP